MVCGFLAISVDVGHLLDVRLAELLARHGGDGASGGAVRSRRRVLVFRSPRNLDAFCILLLSWVLTRLCDVDSEADIADKFRKGDVRHCFPDISKARKLLGYKPAVSFDEGMRELIESSRKAEARDKFEEAGRELKKRGLA